MTDDEDENVGYGRPPRHSRFKPGRSGNPAGRPPKNKRTAPSAELTQLDRIIADEACRPIRVKENGQVVEMTQMQALIRSTIAGAITGGPMSKSLALEMFAGTAVKEHAKRKAEFERMKAYASEGRALERSRKKAGLPPPDLLPHPDDIVFNEDELTFTFTGPIPGTEAAFKQLADLRELMLALVVFADNDLMLGTGEDVRLSLLHFASVALNAQQPPRLRWDAHRYEAVAAWMALRGRRELRFRIEHLCKDIGLSLKPCLDLAASRPMFSPIELGMERIGRQWVRKRGWSLKKALKRMRVESLPKPKASKRK